MKCKRMTPGRFLVAINLAWFAIVSLLLFAIQGERDRLLSKDETVRYLAKEIRGLRFETDMAKARIPEFQQLQFLAQTYEANDQDVYLTAKAAWKWGKVYDISPLLIMAVAHRESNFNPKARSYRIKRDENGNIVNDESGRPVMIAVAYGTMQLNYPIWKDELKLDLSRIDDIDYNVEKGTIILKRYLDDHPGDIGAALFAYWGGDLAGGSYSYPGRVLESKFFNTVGVIQ